MTLYRIKDWDKHFENNRTKELKKLTWVPFPNKHDGDGFTELLDHPDGPAHYGAWCLLVQVASKCDPRGTLLRDTNIPHDPQSLARMSRAPARLWKEVLPRLVSMQWLEVCDNIAVSCDNVASSCDSVAPLCGLPEGKGIEGNSIEGKDCAEPPAPPRQQEPPVISIPILGDKEYPLTQSQVDEWQRLFPNVDVPQTLNEIRAWNLANPSRRKTDRGVLRHVTNWLHKEQNGG